MREAVADLIRDVMPYSLAVFIPPNWDRPYTECFGFTLEEIYNEGARSIEQKLRSAGLPLESLPGPSCFPLDLSTRRARRVRARDAAGRASSAPQRRATARSRGDGAAVRLDRARRRPPHRARGPVHRAVGVRGRRAVAPARRQRLHRRRARAAPPRSISRSAAATRTGSTSSPAASTPAAPLATRRLRPHGSPRALWAARGPVLSSNDRTRRSPASRVGERDPHAVRARARRRVSAHGRTNVAAASVT